MITIPTIFVLGAGGSVGVKFPTGADLRKLLLQVNPDQELHTAAIAAGFKNEEIMDFRRSFFESQLDTIDIFLEQNHDLRAIGKFLIAAQLNLLENDDRLTFQGLRCWYKNLRDLIGPSVEDLRKCRLRIVTFNYDRSLEHYLYKAFRAVNRNPEDPRLLVDYIGNLGFVHMHGILDRLDWQGNGRPYGSTTDMAAIRDAAVHNIMLADEKPQVTYAGLPLSDLFAEAKRVFFFGFGFNERNLAKLPLPDSVASGGVYFGASAKGLPERIQRVLRSRFQMTLYEEIEQVFTTYFENAVDI